MDYNKILDEWADEIYKKMDKAIAIKNSEEVGSIKFLINSGYADGFAMSMAILSQIERKHKRKESNNE